IPVATTVYSFRRYRDAAQARKELAKLSMLDSLTGLPNRRPLAEWFEHSVERAVEDASHMALLFVDLDHFKSVNDNHGHDIGDQFVLHYQPVVSVTDASMIGVEALLRWEHPERGLVFPGDFIQDLEDNGLIVPVGTWVMNTACKQARKWQDQFPDRMFVVKMN